MHFPFYLRLKITMSSSSSSAFNVRGPHITQAWDVRHPRWHGSDGCPQQHSVVSCTNSTTFNGSGYTRLCQGSSMNSWLTWGYWYMFLLLKELLQPDGLPAPTHPLGRGVFNETPSLTLNIYNLNYYLENVLSGLWMRLCRVKGPCRKGCG